MAAVNLGGRKMSQNFHRDREETQDQTVIGWNPGEDKAGAQKKQELLLRVLVYGLGALFVCTLLFGAIAAYFYL